MPSYIKLCAIRDLPILSGRTLGDGTSLLVDAYEDRPYQTLARSVHLRGQLARRACDRCVEQRQHFGECVVLSDQMQGQCTNCHWAQDGNPCVFLEIDAPILQGPTPSFRPDAEPGVARWALALPRGDSTTIYGTDVHHENPSVSSPGTVWGGLSTEDYLRSLQGERIEYVGKIEELDVEIAAAEMLLMGTEKPATKGVTRRRKWTRKRGKGHIKASIPH